MTTSDCILIGTTIFLGFIALFVPYFAELLKRKLFKPILKINFSLKPPGCHKTFYSNTSEKIKSAYYFRFEIENIGKSICKNVENVLENVWKLNSAHQPIKIQDFTPVNLKWSLKPENIQQSINTGRRLYCNIGHLPTKDFQSTSKLIDPDGYKGDDLRLELDLVTILNAQLNCLPPGSYIIQINTYSENYKTLTTYFKINWSGKWNDELEIQFQELVILKTTRPD